MADGPINLSNATRTNLLALQRTTDLIANTQKRLSTGLKVNSAVDNAISYFQARSLNDRATDLSNLKDSIDQGVSSVETAMNGLESIADLVAQMKGIALASKANANKEDRSRSAVQFNDLRQQLDNLANDSSYKGTNMIKGSPANLKVSFSEDGSSTLTVSGIASDSSGLSMVTATTNWVADSDIDAAINDLDSALSALISIFKMSPFAVLTQHLDSILQEMERRRTHSKCDVSFFNDVHHIYANLEQDVRTESSKGKTIICNIGLDLQILRIFFE